MPPLDGPALAAGKIRGSDSEKRLNGYLSSIGIGAGVFLVGGLATVLVSQKGAAVGLFWALSSFGVSGVVGFLFGFPRTVQREVVRPPATEPGGKAEAGSPAPAGVPTDIELQQLPNTHLEEVSDWLTKIIIGVTLVQFREFAAYFRDSAAVFAAGLEGGARADNLAFAQAVMVYFSVLGFLVGFLLTRLLLPQALRVSDQLTVMRKEVRELRQGVQAEVNKLRQVVETARIAPPDPGRVASPTPRRQAAGG